MVCGAYLSVRPRHSLPRTAPISSKGVASSTLMLSRRLRAFHFHARDGCGVTVTTVTTADFADAAAGVKGAAGAAAAVAAGVAMLVMTGLEKASASLTWRQPSMPGHSQSPPRNLGRWARPARCGEAAACFRLMRTCHGVPLWKKVIYAN